MLHFLYKLFDTRSELQIAANDRNLILTGCANEWMVFDAEGALLACGNTQVNAFTKAIFNGVRWTQ